MGVYSGKATRGVMLDLIWGTVILMVSIILTFLVYDNLNLLNILSLAYFWGLTIVLFYHLHISITEKRLEINEMGVFLYSRNRLIKKMYWDDIVSVGTSFLGGKYPRIGFFLTNRDGKVMDINDRDVIGPKHILKEAFKEIASIAAKKGIEIDDPLGWAPPGVVGGLEIVDPSRYKGKIHRSERKRKNTFLTLFL